MRLGRLRLLAWITLATTLAVILWGAYVRASGSGAGCGSHWPTCNGEALPHAKSIATIIEFVHRATSGLSGVLVLIELVWALAALPRRHPARAGAVASMAFMVSEGAVGAALVIFEHVAGDKSAARAAWMSLHLVNTYFLVASLALTAWWMSGGTAPRVRDRGRTLTLLGVGAASLLVTGIAGAITALGDTLFTAPSLARGLADDLSPAANFLQQLRVVHPVLAVVVTVYLLYTRRAIADQAGRAASIWSTALGVLLVSQVLLGFVNLVLLAPIGMQIVHLLVADLVWVAFVLLGAAVLAGDTGEPAEPGPS